LRDIQAGTEGFPKIAIDKVGVRNIELPVTIHRPNTDETFSTVAIMSSYCDLVEDLKGINMSRISRTLVPIFTKEKGFVTDLSRKAVNELAAAHDTDNVYLKLKFKYTWDSASPQTEIDSPEIANVEIETHLSGRETKQYMTVETVGMSLCPCSKEMSLFVNNLNEGEKKIFDGWKKNGNDLWPAMKSLVKKLEMAGFGAHNQKSYVKATVELKEGELLYIEDLVDLINACVSAQTYSILKRPDEKYVTEVSYMSGYIDEQKNLVELDGYGPKFVEDIVRQVADKLNTIMDKTIKDYVVVVRNEESIHSQDIEAVAVLNAGRSLH